MPVSTEGMCKSLLAARNVKRLLVVFLLVSVGCSGLRKESAQIQEAVNLFHRHLNSGEFPQIYAESSSKYKDLTTPEENLRVLQTVHDTLGKVRTTKLIKMEPHYTPWEKAYFLRYMTEFDRGVAVETIVVYVKPDSIKVEVYVIQSDALKQRRLSLGMPGGRGRDQL
jgi:hypothetical protein